MDFQTLLDRSKLMSEIVDAANKLEDLADCEGRNTILSLIVNYVLDGLGDWQQLYDLWLPELNKYQQEITFM